MQYPARCLGGACSLICLLACGCLERPQGGPARQDAPVPQQLPSAKIVAGAGAAAGRVSPVTPEQVAAPLAQRPVLPKWKTPWEKYLERKYKHATAAALPHADSYDSYRTQHSDTFFVTAAPAAPVRVVAEYEPSQAYLLAWLQYLGADVDAIYRQLVLGAWGVVPVLMIYENAAHKSFLEDQLQQAGIAATELTDPEKIIWWPHRLDSVWSRDFGPLGVVGSASRSQRLSFVDFRYYHYRVHDDELPSDLAAEWGVNVFRPDLDFEGGNFMSTGDGLCAASKGVLWYNLHLAQSAVEDLFASYLGCQKTIFPSPLKGEPTTHIDMFSKFASDTRVLVGEYSRAQDPDNARILTDNAALFAATRNGRGQQLELIRIPMPDQGVSSYGTVWRTYTNSLALASAKGKVLLIPVYADEDSRQAAALAAYAAAFPGWQLVPIDSSPMISWGGAMHCLTMQIPGGVLAQLEQDPADLCGPAALQCEQLACGSIPRQGCCDGTVLRYCESGQLIAQDCQASPSCGWGGEWYACGTEGQVDPGGVFPLSCDLSPPDSGAGQPDAGAPAQALPCGAITSEGCCEENLLHYCAEGVLITMDCAGYPACGWSVADGFYDCGTGGAPAPAGDPPRSCTPPAPDAGASADVGADQGSPPADLQRATDAGQDPRGGADGGCRLGRGGMPRGSGLALLLGVALILWVRAARPRRRRSVYQLTGPADDDRVDHCLTAGLGQPAELPQRQIVEAAAGHSAQPQRLGA